jgi:GNAT superfamily N-acetyltransferase
MHPHLSRMLALVDEVFDTKNDPDQIAFSEEDMEKLHALHPFSMNEHLVDDGPVVWSTVIPTSKAIGEAFMNGDISECELLKRTSKDTPFEMIYLCSVLVHPDFRGQGLAYEITRTAIANICAEHKIESLCVWPFSPEGLQLAHRLADEAELPLVLRSEKH